MRMPAVADAGKNVIRCLQMPTTFQFLLDRDDILHVAASGGNADVGDELPGGLGILVFGPPFCGIGRAGVVFRQRERDRVVAALVTHQASFQIPCAHLDVYGGVEQIGFARHGLLLGCCPVARRPLGDLHQANLAAGSETEPSELALAPDDSFHERGTDPLLRRDLGDALVIRMLADLPPAFVEQVDDGEDRDQEQDESNDPFA